MGYFNELIRFSESGELPLDEILAKSKYYRIPGGPHNYKFSLTQKSVDEFNLPYPVTIIEDDFSLILLVDGKKPQGLTSARSFLEVSHFRLIDTIYFCFGYISNFFIIDESHYGGVGGINFIFVRENDAYKIVTPIDVGVRPDYVEPIKNAYLAVKELMCIGKEIDLYQIPL